MEGAGEAVTKWRGFVGIDLTDVLLKAVEELAEQFQLAQVILLGGQQCPEEHVGLT